MKKIFTVLALASVFITVLNYNTTQFIGINNEVTEYTIPLYLKLYNFYGRHLNHGYMVDKITKNSKSEIDKVMSISRWIHNNIKKLPKNVDFVDNHPLTIAERRLGTEGQFSDLLSVLLVYAGIDTFLWSDKDDYRNAVTFFKVDNNWSIVDPYYGIIFINNEKRHASISELKNMTLKNNWSIQNLYRKEIDKSNINKIFDSKFNDTNEVKQHYINQISKFPTQNKINSTSIFKLGGRAYLQSPLNRIQSIIQNN